MSPQIARSSIANVAPTRYWHGTKYDLKSGDVVLPRALHSTPPSSAPMHPGAIPPPDSQNWVYVTTNFMFAWAHAHDSGAEGDPIVALVEPQGPVERDPEYSKEMDAFRCGSAVVIVIDRNPRITARQARSGWKRPDPTESQDVVEETERPT